MPKTIDMPVLERMLAPVSKSLNIEAAKRLIALKADSKVQARVAELAGKCNEGKLTTEEQSEYESIVTADSIISILKSKARYLLTKNSK